MIKTPHISWLLLFTICAITTSREFENEVTANASDGSDYAEEHENEILTNVQNIEATLEMFPKVFLYVTKDNCEYCRALDPVFEEVFRVIQKDHTRKIFVFCNLKL